MLQPMRGRSCSSALMTLGSALQSAAAGKSEVGKGIPTPHITMQEMRGGASSPVLAKQGAWATLTNTVAGEGHGQLSRVL